MTTEKLIKVLSRLLQTTAAVFSGAVVNSLWISHTDGWQVSMPIVLLCLTLERYIVRD